RRERGPRGRAHDRRSRVPRRRAPQGRMAGCAPRPPRRRGPAGGRGARSGADVGARAGRAGGPDRRGRAGAGPAGGHRRAAGGPPASTAGDHAGGARAGRRDSRGAPRVSALPIYGERGPVGEVMGCGSLKVYSRDLAELAALAVRADWQRAGVGGALLAALIAEARVQGLAEVLALTRKPGFFLKVGFAPAEREHFPLKV